MKQHILHATSERGGELLGSRALELPSFWLQLARWKRCNLLGRPVGHEAPAFLRRRCCCLRSLCSFSLSSTLAAAVARAHPCMSVCFGIDA